jgi:hypothetical protein
MKTIRYLSALLFPAILLLATGGCLVGTTPDTATQVDPGPVGVVDGTLIVDWTISGTKDPAQCQQGGARSIDIIISGSGGGEFQQDCGVFATSIRLAPGSYSAVAVLIDSSGRDRTTELRMDPFVIHGNDQLTIPIDFPADSFR